MAASSDESKPESSPAKTVEFLTWNALICALIGIATAPLLVSLAAAIDVWSFNDIQVFGFVCVSQGVSLTMLGFSGRRFVRRLESTESLLEIPPKEKK